MSAESELNKFLSETKSQIKNGSVINLRKTTSVIVTELGSKSPVDKAIFQRNWRYKVIIGSGALIASSHITNKSEYAIAIELGSKVGSLPWKSVGPKTVEMNSRIYSKQAIGGVIGPLFSDGRAESLATKLATDIGDSIK